MTLSQVLLARESRVQRQAEALEAWKKPIVSFTMNIPGPVKMDPLIRRSFRWGCQALEGRVKPILHRDIREEVTGCEAIFVADMDPVILKQCCMALEEETPLGRLFDLDVLDPGGARLTRGTQRCCIVCGAPGRGCASRRLHSLPELTRAVWGIMEAHFFGDDARAAARLAVGSLLEEVNATPKPGLVDRRNNGSHRDMDIALFTASAKTLEPYFLECIRIGRETREAAIADCFQALRAAGREAEKAMYRTTGGVNTHKGAIFTLGLLCGSWGRLWKGQHPSLEKLLETCAKLGECAVQADFCRLENPETAGERLYAARGIRGIRGEAAAGLPSVTETGLPAYRQALARGLCPNDAAVVALLHLIARVEDTNLHHRGGPEGAAWAAAKAKAILPWPAMEAVEALDDAFIARNLSPGGCADLLAVTVFLHGLETA